MDEIKYLDFDLLIERAEEGYTARVLNSPAGQATADFNLPFSELELENFLLRVGRTRRGVRRLESPEMEAAKSFGGRLFNAVLGGEVRGCLRSSLDEANRQEVGLRIRLRLVGAPKLADLPWEYLYNPALNRFLALSVKTPIVRYLDLPERIRPLAVQPPLRVLVMISSPSNYSPLDVEKEWAKLKEALGDLEQRGLVTLERLGDATLTALQRRLRWGEYHIFHFIGHGGFDERAQDGVLLLEDEHRLGRPVSGQYLGTLLHDERTLRLAILNACEGARTSRSDPFAGTAQSLVQQGIPAVIAMQFEITDEAAIAMSHEFYTALADGYPVDAALSEARKAIFAQENDVEWGTPVLYMRSPDGRIFDIKWVREEERKSAQSAALYHEAQAAMVGEDWTTAIEKLQALLALDPAHAEAVVKLKQTRQQQELATLYARGHKHYKAGRWPQALAYFRRVQKIQSNYKNVGTLIATVERAMTPKQSLPAPQATLSRLKVSIPVALVLLLVVIGGGYLVLKVLPSLLPSTATPTPTAMPVLTVTSSPPTPDLEAQQVGWGPAFYEREAGICINNCAEFIPWVELEEELPQQLLPQVSRIPSGSTVALKDSQEKRDWIVQIVNQNGDEIGNIWFGTDPYNDGAFDGLVRVGSFSHPAVVWDAFQRYSDGSYRRQITPTYTPIPTPIPEEMIHIPAGSFIQGLTDAQIDAAYQDCIESELPQHVKALCWHRTSEKYRPNVYLDEFYIDKYEVTNAQYDECVDAGYCTSPSPRSSNMRTAYFDDPTYANYPVIYVTWYGANTYCQWMGKRLPTEAEWEKAARGENGMLWPWGNSFSQERTQIRPGGMAPDTSDTIRVGSYPGGASPYGAMDMVGNVMEWVADWYDKEYYDIAPTRNPEGPPSGEKKVIRGGSWNSNAYSARPSARAPASPSEGYFDIGFRCAQ